MCTYSLRAVDQTGDKSAKSLADFRGKIWRICIHIFVFYDIDSLIEWTEQIPFSKKQESNSILHIMLGLPVAQITDTVAR